MTGTDPADRNARVSPPSPSPLALRAAATWGLVGTLTFLVLHQGYLLAGGRFIGVVPVTLVALAVGVTVGVAARRLAARASGNGQG